MRNKLMVLLFSILLLPGCALMSAADKIKDMRTAQPAQTTMMPAPVVIDRICPPKKVSHSCYAGYDGAPVSFPATIEPDEDNPSVAFWHDFKTRMEFFIIESRDRIPKEVWETEWSKLMHKINTRMDLYEKLNIRETCTDGIVQSGWDAFDECATRGP